MWFIAQVTKWSSPRQSKGHINIRQATEGRYIMLNSNRITNVQRKGYGTSFNFTENLSNPRDGNSYIEIANNIDDVTDAMDTAYTAEYVTVFPYRDNDIHKPYEETVLLRRDVAYIEDVNGSTTTCLVHYTDGGGKQRTLLCYDRMEALHGTYLLRDIDGNIYRTVTIGTDIWIVQGLRTTHYANGAAIPNLTADAAWLADTTGAYCWYDNNIGNKEIYGGLYNWYAVNNASGLAYFERGGVQEAGWRVPSLVDWGNLVTAVGGNAATAGGLLKERTYAHWDSPNDGATDYYGFQARGHGNRHTDSEDLDIHGFESLGVFNDMWASNEAVDPSEGEAMYMIYFSPAFMYWDHEKYGGMGVRCMRDV